MRYNYFEEFELLIIVSRALRFKLIEKTKHIRWLEKLSHSFIITIRANYSICSQ